MRLYLFQILLIAGFIQAPLSQAAEPPGSGVFEACIENLQTIARQEDVPEAIVNDVLGTLSLQSRVIELDRDQPEFRQSFSAYLQARVSQRRVERGRELYARHRQFLNRLSREYGVPGRYLISFWGMETNFGSYLGGMPTLDSLATLACDPRRSEFFTDELIAGLHLLAREDMDPAKMVGSWAGAMGHTQFMPSSYMAYAVDGDGDGVIDLWNSEIDALTSAANYLAQLGWQRGERWGREVLLPDDFPYLESGLSQSAPLAHWQELGVRRANGQELPSAADMQASVIVPMGHRGPAFLAYSNFEVIMKWNRSQAYAIAVGHLADRIAGAGRLSAALPEVEYAASRSQILMLQQGLVGAGFDPGEPDGMLGPATRSALRAWQQAKGRVADGYPDPETLATIKTQSIDPQAKAYE